MSAKGYKVTWDGCEKTSAGVPEQLKGLFTFFKIFFFIKRCCCLQFNDTGR